MQHEMPHCLVEYPDVMLNVKMPHGIALRRIHHTPTGNFH